MAKLKWEGIKEYELMLSKLEAKTEEIAGKAIYEGAKVMADAMKEATQGLPVDDRYVKNGEMLHGISQEQKDGLVESFGISPMENKNGYWNVKLGFDGYNSVTSKRYPDGQPNSLIARSVNAGTSFRQRIPFIDSTIRAYKSKTEEAIKKKLDEELEKIAK